jgi:putative hydrolase of the HAD superfamily
MPFYKHLFFDLDHTIWDFETNAKQSLQQIFIDDLQSKLNTSFDEFYDRYSFHNHQLWARYEKGFIGVDELKWKRMWRAMLDFKLADEPLSKKLSDTFLTVLPTKKEVFPYTFEILDYLANKNYNLHLITNGFEVTQHAKLKNSGLDKYFPIMITSEASNSLKPKKEIFDFALEKANATLSESIMIGDNQHADIGGALNAGMDAIFVNHINDEIKVKPTYTIYHLKELEDIL